MISPIYLFSFFIQKISFFMHQKASSLYSGKTKYRRTGSLLRKIPNRNAVAGATFIVRVSYPGCIRHLTFRDAIDCTPQIGRIGKNDSHCCSIPRHHRVHDVQFESATTRVGSRTWTIKAKASRWQESLLDAPYWESRWRNESLHRLHRYRLCTIANIGSSTESHSFLLSGHV